MGEKSHQESGDRESDKGVGQMNDKEPDPRRRRQGVFLMCATSTGFLSESL